MTFHRTKPFLKEYKKLSASLRQKTQRQLLQMARDIHHPSLRVRKMVNYPNIWEARIDGQYRITFALEEEVIILRRIGTHEIYRNP